jgi:hypothetical protein
MGFLKTLGVASIAIASGVQAAVSSTGFTVSLEGVDYYLPGKPSASISGCEELKASFKDGPFVPITVVKDGAVDIASYSKDDVWQPAFLEGMYPPHCHHIIFQRADVHQLYTPKAVYQATHHTRFSVVPQPLRWNLDRTSSMQLVKCTKHGDYSRTFKELSLNRPLQMVTAHTPSFQPALSAKSKLLLCHPACTSPKPRKSH